MAERTAFEAALAQLTTASQALTAAVTANSDRVAAQSATQVAAIAAAQAIVPDGDLTAIQNAITEIANATNALNASVAPAPAPAP